MNTPRIVLCLAMAMLIVAPTAQACLGLPVYPERTLPAARPAIYAAEDAKADAFDCAGDVLRATAEACAP